MYLLHLIARPESSRQRVSYVTSFICTLKVRKGGRAIDTIAVNRGNQTKNKTKKGVISSVVVGVVGHRGQGQHERYSLEDRVIQAPKVYVVIRVEWLNGNSSSPHLPAARLIKSFSSAIG